MAFFGIYVRFLGCRYISISLDPYIPSALLFVNCGFADLMCWWSSGPKGHVFYRLGSRRKNKDLVESWRIWWLILRWRFRIIQISLIYLEPQWPLFFKVNPLKTRPFPTKNKGHVGSRFTILHFQSQLNYLQVLLGFIALIHVHSRAKRQVCSTCSPESPSIFCWFWWLFQSCQGVDVVFGIVAGWVSGP